MVCGVDAGADGEDPGAMAGAVVKLIGVVPVRVVKLA
jgi:hypothetical protein